MRNELIGRLVAVSVIVRPKRRAGSPTWPSVWPKASRSTRIQRWNSSRPPGRLHRS